MKTYYQIKGFLKFAEEDNWKEGCDPDTTTSFFVDVHFTGKSAEEVIEKAADFLGAQPDGIERNVCGELGRVDFATEECEDGTKPSKSELAAWKKGKQKIWYCVYSANVEKVTRAKV
jgi:hypothetical protein